MKRYPLALLASMIGVGLVAAPGFSASEAQFGVSFEAVQAADGSVDLTIRNMSKVPVSVSGLAVTQPDASRCQEVDEAISIAAGEMVRRKIVGCRTTGIRLPANRSLLAVAPRSELAGSTIKVGAQLDRLGARHGIEARFEAPR